MSSHREAPEISKDPVADSTDLYAFVSPDEPDTVTIIANYVPLEGPTAARTSTSSATTCCTPSTSTTTGDGEPTSSTSSGSRAQITNPSTFLYNTGPDRVAHRPELEPPPDLHGDPGRPGTQAAGAGARRRAWPARRATSGRCRPRTTPPSPRPRCTASASGTTVFAGQRAEGFYVDLGADLRPRRPAALRAGPRHLRPDEHGPRADGRRASTPPRASTCTASPSRCR